MNTRTDSQSPNNTPRKANWKTWPIRLFEWLNLIGLVVIFLGIVPLFSFVFYGLDLFFENGIRDSRDCIPDDFWTYLYFSVVTISSLGYGDLHPVGFGRLAAGVEVVLGLVLIAAVVAKIVSEQQSRLMRLLYSSDQERRIKQFRLDLAENAKLLDQAARDHKHVALRRIADSSVALLYGLRSYLLFQMNHGMLLEVVGRTNFRGLLECLRELSEKSAWIAVHVPERDNATIKRLERVIQHCIYNVDHVKERASDTRSLRVCELVHKSQTQYHIWRKRLQKTGHIILGKDYSELSDYLLSEVRSEWREGPRPRNIHKRIAERLGISYGLSSRAIEAIENERSDSGQ
jgi:hypothetical protein